MEDDERAAQNLIAIATRGYKIQSQILRIPDRWGFFSKESRDLRIKEAFLFVALIIMKCFSCPPEGGTIYLLAKERTTLLPLIVTLRALDLLMIVFYRAMSNHINRSGLKVRKD